MMNAPISIFMPDHPVTHGVWVWIKEKDVNLDQERR